ncbi:hypothetical protein LCGC14_0771910 [marine sediment metagenome]|uniref:Uncharacterized protein n=1 Tax=marine sediment metagenome TaxID=412755 RepID=A0A0F9Q268_9ZZZZ
MAKKRKTKEEKVIKPSEPKYMQLFANNKEIGFSISHKIEINDEVYGTMKITED